MKTGTTEALVEFEPGVYITINDTFTGMRKLARVSTTGHSYTDLDDADSTEFPTYLSLEPAEVGNILGWGLHIIDNEPDQTEAWRTLADQLINSGKDVLTYNRAAYWAFHKKNYNFAEAMAAGEAETKAIRAGRAKMDSIISAAGSL